MKIKHSSEPLSVNLVLSALKKYITSFSQAEKDGGAGDFQAKSILCRAKCYNVIVSRATRKRFKNCQQRAWLRPNIENFGTSIKNINPEVF